MSVEEDKDLIEFNKKFESYSDKIGFEPVPELVSGPSNSQKNVSFHNSTNANIALYWLNYQGRPSHYDTIASHRNFSVHTYTGHPWIGQFEDTGDLCRFRLGTGPGFSKDGHRVYVGSRPMPDRDDDDHVWEQISLHRPKSQSLLQTATQTVVKLIDYDHDTARSLHLPRTVQDEVLTRIDRRNKKISPV